MHQQNTQSSPQDHNAGKRPDRYPDTFPTPDGNPVRRVVSSVETDLFCEGCGYNLRTQKVWEEPNTKILVIQCPECDKCHAARGLGGAKLAMPDRLVQLAAIIWVLFLGLLYIGSGVIEMSSLLVLTDATASEFRETPTAEVLIGPLAVAAMSLFIGGLIVIFSSSPTLNWARWMVLFRSAIYFSGLGIMVIDYFTSSYYGPDRAIAILLVGLLMILIQFGAGMFGVYWGRPVFMWLCTNILPATLTNMIQSYWSSQIVSAPVENHGQVRQQDERSAT